MLTLVPTPIGNLDDISIRALKALESAQTLLCEDTRVAKKLLGLLQQRHAIKPNIKRFISLHSHNEKEFLSKIDPSFFEESVVYVSDAGMPGISDPGAVLVDYCIQNGIEYDVLPGASAALTAYVASGFLHGKFLFFGFLPHKGQARKIALQEAIYSGYDVILYESPHRIEKLLDEIVALEPERMLFLAKELTKMHQTTKRGSAKELKEWLKGTNIKGEWVVVIQGGAPNPACTISKSDILRLDLPKKDAARLLAKITQESASTWYERLVSGKW